MKKILGLPIGFMVLGVLLISAGKVEAVPYPFFDDFESGLGNWTAGGQWDLIDSTCFGGDFAVTDSPGGSYPDNYNGSLTLATDIDLSTAASPVLIFWHKMWIAYDDNALVDISTDGGFNWSTLTNWHHEKYLSTWTLSRFDLSAYVGMQVKIRFRLRESSVNVSDGWYIDNVAIRDATDESTMPYPFSEDFEGTLDNWLVSDCEWSLVPSDCLGGNSAITDSPLGSYPDAANSMITLAGNVDLSTAISPVLIFWHKMWIAYDDNALVEISADGGVSWSTLTNWHHEKYLSTWTLSRLDLSTYVGMQVKIRFRLRESSVNVSDGWYLDKVEIREADDEPTLPYPFSDDFEGTLDNWLVSDCEWGLVPSDECADGFAVTDSPLGSYPDAANSMITLAGNIDLLTATFPVLSFWHKYSIAYADNALVEISTDGGVSWSTIANWYHEQYISSWNMEQYDLRPYVGMQVKIRFRLRESSVNVSDGWYLDTVAIGERDTADGDGVPDELDNCTVIPNWCQRDTNGDNYGNLCDGDLNNDGSTNTLDLNLYKPAHRTEPGDPSYTPDADFNGDGVINTLDLSIYKGLHRQDPGPSCCAP